MDKETEHEVSDGKLEIPGLPTQEISIKGISVKLFMGCPLPSDIHLQLTNNSAWKEQTITPKEEGNVLTIVHHEGRNYLGSYLKSPIQKLQEIKDLERAVKSEIFALCPELDHPSHKLFVFPQVFIS